MVTLIEDRRHSWHNTVLVTDRAPQTRPPAARAGIRGRHVHMLLGEYVAMSALGLDEIGPWTEMKLHILRDYAQQYATILASQTQIRHFAYIDGFAGAGQHIAKRTGQLIDGSPAIALQMDPQFSHYHFIDMSGKRTEQLNQLAEGRRNVTVYHGDCNRILMEDVFPQCRWTDFRRALCLLDPYDIDLDWEVVQHAGSEGSIEIFLNFMIMDVNRNVARHDRSKVTQEQSERMTRFWGDESWTDICYRRQKGLFEEMEEKATNTMIAEGYRQRLLDVAGFKHVTQPLPMRNSTGAVIYYFFFASPNETGYRIAKHVFDLYRKRGLPDVD